MKRKVFSLLAMVVVLSLLAACAPKVVKETVIVEKPVEKVVTATPEPVAQIYYEDWIAQQPVCALKANPQYMNMCVHSQLVTIDWEWKPRGMLADSWESQDGGKVWVFHMRKDAKFHDGHPVTAEDVVFSWDVYADPKVGARKVYWTYPVLGYEDFKEGKADHLAGVEAVDEYTVRIELTDASPLWVALGGCGVFVLPKHLLEDIPSEELVGNEFWTDNQVGCGPFKWSKYVPDQYVEVVRFDDYFLGAPKLEKYVFVFFTEDSTVAAAYQNEEIYGTVYHRTRISVEDVERLDAIPNLDPIVMNAGKPVFLRVNHNDPAFQDVRVRQAIRYGIDVKTILETIYMGLAEPMVTGLIHDWAIPDDLEQYEYNPEKAKELLDAAGWDYGQEVTMYYYYGDSLNANLIAAIQANLAEIGVKFVPQKIDAAALRAVRNDTPPGIIEYAGFGAGADPSVIAPTILCGEWIAEGYCNPRVDELFAEGMKYATVEERAPIYQEIARIMNEELPYVWLWSDVRPLGFNRRVWGPYEHYAEQGQINFEYVYNEVEKWYVKD